MFSHQVHKPGLNWRCYAPLAGSPPPFGDHALGSVFTDGSRQAFDLAHRNVEPSRRVRLATGALTAYRSDSFTLICTTSAITSPPKHQRGHLKLVKRGHYDFALTLLAALGYVLIERLQGTALASAQVDTLHIKLLKVGAVITRNTRLIRLYLASNWPSADIFEHAARQLRSP